MKYDSKSNSSSYTYTRSRSQTHANSVHDQTYTEYTRLQDVIVSEQTINNLMDFLVMPQLNTLQNMGLLQKIGECIASSICYKDSGGYFKEILLRV